VKGSRFKGGSGPLALSLAPCAFLIRPMTVADLAAVAVLEAENPSPWAIEQLTSELNQENGWMFIAESNTSGLIHGFAYGRSCAGEAELLKIAVGRKYQRQGVAAQLMTHILGYLAAQGTDHCFLELRATNLPALALYERFGFCRMGLRKNYYASPSEDAITMKKTVVTFHKA